LLAATFLTLDDLAPDRIICGIGAWWDPLAKNVGIERRKPLKAMRETVEVMRRLLRLENVTFEGEFHKVRGIELDVVHGRREPRNVPILIGATGPNSSSALSTKMNRRPWTGRGNCSPNTWPSSPTSPKLAV